LSDRYCPVQTLLELVDYVNSAKQPFVEQIMPEVVAMVSPPLARAISTLALIARSKSGLCRALPVGAQDACSKFSHLIFSCSCVSLSGWTFCAGGVGDKVSANIFRPLPARSKDTPFDPEAQFLTSPLFCDHMGLSVCV